MNVLFFDVETTGLSISKDRVVQLVLQGIRGNELSPAVNIMFNPCIPISPEASAIHRITNEMVRDHPTFAMMASEIYATLMEADVIAGYNIKRFDIPILAEELARCGYNWPPHDIKIIDSYNTWVKRSPRSLGDAYMTFAKQEMDPEKAHDAEYDVGVTIETTTAMMDAYCIDIHDMISDSTDGNLVDPDGKIGKNDQGEYVFLFGKNKGLTVLSNTGYAEWMLRNDFAETTKRLLRQILGIVQ